MVVTIFALAACSPPHTVEDPAVAGEGGWEVEYISGVLPEQYLPCLWNDRTQSNAVLSCDWANPVSVIPSDAHVGVLGEGGWELEYVKISEKTIKCLWNSRGDKDAVLSCDW